MSIWRDVEESPDTWHVGESHRVSSDHLSWPIVLLCVLVSALVGWVIGMLV